MNMTFLKDLYAQVEGKMNKIKGCTQIFEFITKYTPALQLPVQKKGKRKKKNNKK